MTTIRPVILSGGSGTRLWPLSRPEMPKQFVPLFEGETLFGLTMERILQSSDASDVIVVTGTSHVYLVEAETRGVDTRLTTIVEPVGRNTTAAIVAAALVSSPDDVLVVLPSDHLIEDSKKFAEAVSTAVELAAEGNVVTFGVQATRPETGFGYIEIGPQVSGGYRVKRFREKPSPTEAASMVEDGRHLWNAGMFVVRADRVLDEVTASRPELVSGVRESLPHERTGLVVLGAKFGEVESISFDYSVMEVTDSAVVVPLDAGWDDVGSYRSLLAASPTDAQGNHVSGDVKLDGVTNSFVLAGSRRVVVAGLDGVVVVETPDEVLIIDLDRSQDVRSLQLRETDD